MRKLSAVIIILVLLSNMALAVTDRPMVSLNNIRLVNPEAGEYAFAVFGDFRTSRRDRPYPAVFKQILNEINTIGPAFIISTGDAYYGYGGSFQGFKNEISYFLNTIKSLDFPFFNAVGNHEVTGDAEREKYFEKRTGRLYGSFNAGKSHFILLNTEEPGKEGAISGEQMKWLEKDLGANRDAAHIFVFMHRPLFSAIDPELLAGKSFKDKNNRDYIHGLFRKHKVKAVFAGHEHLFKDETKNGIRYIITGGGGAPLYQPPSEGGFFHYLLVRIKNNDVSIELLNPYNLQIRNISGNDGFGTRTEIEMSNISYADFDIKNLCFKMPMADANRYKVKAVSISKKEEQTEHKAKIRQVKDNGDGTATVSIETQVPKHGTVRVMLEVEF